MATQPPVEIPRATCQLCAGSGRSTPRGFRRRIISAGVFMMLLTSAMGAWAFGLFVLIGVVVLLLGLFIDRPECPRCQGKGYVTVGRCPRCGHSDERRGGFCATCGWHAGQVG